MLRPPWGRVLELAWDGFCTGSAPIGAVVTNCTGEVVAEGRSQRHDMAEAEPNQLAGSRIAHAELNALARLPVDGYYHDHDVFVSVEPCCLCMGAAMQTGVGVVRYAWADAYAGASDMVLDNAQARLKQMRVEGPVGGVVEQLAGLLLAVHYVLDRADKPHVTAPMRVAHPDLFSLAETSDVLDLLGAARVEQRSLMDVVPALAALLAPSGGPPTRPGRSHL